MNSCRANARGFTLVEMITVIIVLSVVATIGSNFIISSLNSYNQIQTRSKLINTSRQALERITRQVRGALPHSVRETNAEQCLEFLPVSGGGNYLSSLPDLANGADGTISFAVANHGEDFGSAAHVAVGALAATELYGAGAGSLAALAGRSANLVTLTAVKIWLRNSINARFYLLNNPQAFCVVGRELRFYQNLDVTAGSVPGLANDCAGANCQVMAINVSAIDVTLAGGTEDRNTKVTIDISFEEGGETAAFQQEVLIRNVP